MRVSQGQGEGEGVIVLESKLTLRILKDIVSRFCQAIKCCALQVEGAKAEAIQREIFELLEVLLDLMLQYRAAEPVGKELGMELLELGRHLLSVYGATLSLADKALLRCLLLVQKLLKITIPETVPPASKPQDFIGDSG